MSVSVVIVSIMSNYQNILGRLGARGPVIRQNSGFRAGHDLATMFHGGNKRRCQPGHKSNLPARSFPSITQSWPCSATTTIPSNFLPLLFAQFSSSRPFEIQMPRDSSDNPKAMQLLMFDQNLINQPIGGIEARVVHEKDLDTDHLQWLLGLDGNSPRSVGISPAYSKSGGLPALACALDTRVLIIKFHSTRPHRDGGAIGSGTQARNIERRNLLEEELLCHPLCTLYAFDLSHLALALHLHLHICLTDAIDIQSALQIPGRSVEDSVKKAIDDPSGDTIFSDNLVRAFENMLYQSSKHIDLTDIVQRAWLCCYIGQYDYEAIRDMFYKAPKVNTANFSQEV